MTRLLYIQASPRGDRSAARTVAEAYIDALRKKDAAVDVDTLDVWKNDLPPFNGPALEAKYAGLSGQPLSKTQIAAWDAIATLGRRFCDAEQIVLSVPMWNFGVPYRLKHEISRHLCGWQRAMRLPKAWLHSISPALPKSRSGQSGRSHCVVH